MYDVVIIGAGSAGLAARKEISRQTSNYLVVDSGPLGTTCARVGCMPSKVLIEAANIYSQSEKLTQIGVINYKKPVLDGKALMNHVRTLRDKYVGHVLSDMEKWQSTHFKAGQAVITSKECMNVGFEKVHTKSFIVATGSRPILPKAWGDTDGCLTTDDIFEMKDLPRSMIIIGTGAIGLELSHAFARLGVEVTTLGELKTLGALSDPQILESATEYFKKEFTLVDQQVEKIQKAKEGFQVKTKQQTYSAEIVLVAVGRRPNLEGLNLEAAGAIFDESGLPEFSKETLRIKGTNGYFVGDVNKQRPILHEAVDQGRIAAQNALRPTDLEVQPRTRLAIIFTLPNIAIVGQSFKELKERRTAFISGHVSFKNQGRAVAKLENEGGLTVYADPKSGKVLGAEIFAPGGEHLAHLIAWAIEADRSVFCLLSNPFYHPVLEEGLRTALMSVARNAENGVEKLRALRCDEMPADASLD